MFTSRGAPLAGVVVADFSRTLAGAQCSIVLADMGAEVIMIEPTKRAPGGVAKGGLPATIHKGIDTRYNYQARGKKSLSLDIRSKRGRDLFLDLAQKLDVVVDNWRPGTSEKLGVNYESLKEVNPMIISCSITGYGCKGPYRDRGAWDMIAAADAGLLSVCGEPGRPPAGMAFPMVDTVTGMWAAQGVTTALFQREQTRMGQKVEVSLFETALHLLVNIPTAYYITGVVPGPPGAARPAVGLAGAFKTRDGYIVTGALGDRMFAPFSRALGHEEWAEDPRFSTEAERVRHKNVIWSLVQEVFATRGTDEWVAALLDNKVPVAPVNTVDKALAIPQVEALGIVVSITGAEGEPVRVVRTPVSLSEHQPGYGPAPTVGKHTEEILAGFLGYSEQQIADLRKDAVI